MFEFLTGIIQVFTNIFQAIQSVCTGIVHFVAWISDLALSHMGDLNSLLSLVPYQVFIIGVPLLCVVIVSTILKAMSWIKHMLPFN